MRAGRPPIVSYDVVEICAGAGGQALGLERAGFEHALAVELDGFAAATLRSNRPGWRVAEGDVADPAVWDPSDYEGVALLAGGVPCPPFSLAGRQLGANDERDLFAWAVELCARMQPRALLLENVRGLSMPRFAAYRQAVIDRLAEAGYVADWKLLQAADYGVAQLRPRFVLVAMREADAPYFRWPAPIPTPGSVGDVLADLMGANGWPYASEWARAVTGIAPTIVGGSKKHGGADLGPTRAKAAWRRMHVDGLGVADAAPGPEAPHFSVKPPKLTVEMVARLQGWDESSNWHFAGRKTAQYRQIGNAFPPPLAEAVGRSIMDALQHVEPTTPSAAALERAVHDDLYLVLRDAEDFVRAEDLAGLLPSAYDNLDVERRLEHLSRDFEIDVIATDGGPAYRLGAFRAFTGQDDHSRHLAFASQATRGRIS